MPKFKHLEEKKEQRWLPLPPSHSPRSLKGARAPLSDVEQSHSGRADKKIVVKELGFYDNVPTASRETEGESVSGSGATSLCRPLSVRVLQSRGWGR